MRAIKTIHLCGKEVTKEEIKEAIRSKQDGYVFHGLIQCSVRLGRVQWLSATGGTREPPVIVAVSNPFGNLRVYSQDKDYVAVDRSDLLTEALAVCSNQGMLSIEEVAENLGVKIEDDPVPVARLEYDVGAAMIN